MVASEPHRCGVRVIVDQRRFEAGQRDRPPPDTVVICRCLAVEEDERSARGAAARRYKASVVRRAQRRSPSVGMPEHDLGRARAEIMADVIAVVLVDHARRRPAAPRSTRLPTDAHRALSTLSGPPWSAGKAVELRLASLPIRLNAWAPKSKPGVGAQKAIGLSDVARQAQPPSLRAAV